MPVLKCSIVQIKDLFIYIEVFYSSQQAPFHPIQQSWYQLRGPSLDMKREYLPTALKRL